MGNLGRVPGEYSKSRLAERLGFFIASPHSSPISPDDLEVPEEYIPKEIDVKCH